MKELLSIRSINLALLACASFLPVNAAEVAPEPAVPFSGAPSPEFNELLSPALRKQLGIALIELAYGDSVRARARAQVAATPERLTVYFDTGDYGVRRADDLKRWAGDAVDNWNATAHTSPFEVTASRAAASVLVEFKERVGGNGRTYAGYVTWRRTVRYSESGMSVSVSARIQVANRTPGGRLMSENQIRQAVAHELGHVLGLSDSSSHDEAMGPVPASGASAELGQRERRALMELDYRAHAIMNSAPRRAIRSRVPQIFRFIT